MQEPTTEETEEMLTLQQEVVAFKAHQHRAHGSTLFLTKGDGQMLTH
jgi:hypothetical protein